MDGDVKTAPVGPLNRAHADAPRAPVRPARTVRWLVIVGLLILIVLGGLYGFNAFREQAIATFFANNKPPAAEISAVVAETQAVPRFAPGIGSLAAVQQVTVTPEIGGRVTEILFEPGASVKAGDPLVQLNDAPDTGRPRQLPGAGALGRASICSARKPLAPRQFESRADGRPVADRQLDQANAQIAKTQAVIAQKLIRAPFAGKLGVRQIDLGQFVNAGAPIVTPDRPVARSTSISRCPRRMRSRKSSRGRRWR